ncbi:Hvo_1808 family surface protein [Halorubrum rutilum]|uniref:Hvo_1808 family surface protein n=1 Tax=Halorubrum rutilum TaxID=1364933 RepID=A0ABD6AHW7_9EURY|nr:Hvo_1808 family surface protein [Halorubrum rutilum]
MRRVLTLSVVAAAIALLSLGVGGVAAAGPVAAGPVAESVAVNSAAAGGAAPASATAAECEAGDGADLVGCWNGTHYEEELSFNQSDGLNESELEALTHLTMARVEHLRERPFREDVPVATVTRSEYANDTASGGNGSTDEAFRRWNDQVWEALFVVGEDENANDEIDAVFGGAVSGFYSPAQDRIVLVVPEGEEARIDPSTLAHELVHGMQDQYHDLTRPRYAGATQDGDLAVDGIVEGEAVHVEELYAARCAADWTCLDAPSGGGGGSPADFNFGILQTVLQPYSDGALYVEELVDEGGWEAVNETMTEPPGSTAEVIHRNPEYETRNVTFEDAATGEWETYPDQGVDGAETTGEASMFVMFWYQSFEYGYPVLDPDASPRENVRIHTRPDEELRTRANYNYAHESTDGWAGDELYPYRAGDGDDARDGYVWVTEWQTPGDAADFRETYVTMITAHGGDEYEAGRVYEIDGGDFPGAYGVVRDGTRVTIAHAPTPDGVLEVRPDADLAPPATDGDGTDDTGDGGAGDEGGSDGDDGTDEGIDGDDADGSSGPDASTGDAAPGFGVVAALLGLLAAVSLLARRTRD